MSLTVTGSAKANIPPISQGTHLAVCNLLVDLGMQYNETYKNSSRKVMIGWEIPDEKIMINEEEHSRTISKRYTASLNEAATLRRDLAAWRGRDFTGEELAAFDLKNIVGKSCMINIIHSEYNGKVYANVGSIMALPKGFEAAKLSEPATVFDLDTASLDDVEDLPNWIGDIVKKSSTYQDMLKAEQTPIDDGFTELPDEDPEDLPF